MPERRPAATTSDRRWVPVGLVAAQAPVSYFTYAVGVEWLRHGRTLLQSPLSRGMVLAAAGLAGVGALAVLAWRRDHPATLLAAVGVPLAWPWLYTSVPAGGGHVLIPCVAVGLVAGAEALVRHPTGPNAVLVTPAGRIALAVGLVHFAFGFALQVLARPYWLDVSGSGLWYTFLLLPGVLFVSGLGLVSVGALPVLLWERRRLLSPGLVVAGWVLAALWWVHRHLGHLVLSEFNGIGWARLDPGPDYMATWVVPLVGLVVAAGLELVVRRLFDRTVGRRRAGG